ncbi:hypothetical protein ACOMHN_048437 [Nucella lapillus]
MVYACLLVVVVGLSVETEPPCFPIVVIVIVVVRVEEVLEVNRRLCGSSSSSSNSSSNSSSMSDVQRLQLEFKQKLVVQPGGRPRVRRIGLGETGDEVSLRQIIAQSVISESSVLSIGLFLLPVVRSPVLSIVSVPVVLQEVAI